MGTTFAVFHSVGTVLHFRESFNRCARYGDISFRVDFSNMFEMLSGPIALQVFSDNSFARTVSSFIKENI